MLKGQALSEVDSSPQQRTPHLAFALTCTAVATSVDLGNGISRRKRTEIVKRVTVRSLAGVERGFALGATSTELQEFLAKNGRSVRIVHQAGGEFKVLDLGAFSTSPFLKEADLSCLPNGKVVHVKAGNRDFYAAANEPTLEVTNRFTKRYYVRFTPNVDWPAKARVRVCLEAGDCPVDDALVGYLEGSVQSDKLETQAAVRISSDESKPLTLPGEQAWMPEYGVIPEASVDIDGKLEKLRISVSKPLYGAVCQVLPTDYQGFCTKRYGSSTLVIVAGLALLAKYRSELFNAIRNLVRRRRQRDNEERPDWFDDGKAG